MNNPQHSKNAITTVSIPITGTILFICYILAFCIPFFLPGPQIVTGTIINALLYFAALNLPRKQLLPLVIFPSLATLSRGLIFGPATLFLIYFLPFIWLGNYLLILSCRQFISKMKNPAWAVLVSAGIKYFVLVLFARILFSFRIVPSQFLISMGMMQFITAVLGGTIIFGGKRLLGFFPRKGM